ncbi:hypothetical protein ACFV1F_22380 [Streptomyces sp. NPDC059590]|uniref:hypothetical protein n=1 Tax=Streptomyces sp. NPDC059590 TaxID=3346877 RepID=UPI0036CF7DEE
MSSPADTVEVPQSERLERLRVQLQGRPVGRRTPKAVPVPAMNLLYGVMMRGAARLDAGLQPTDLEEQMLSLLRRVASEEEVREFGRVFKEEESSARAARVFPAVLTARGVEEGYAFADLVADLPALREQIAGQPNLNLVDLDRLPEGAPQDSPEFVQGLADYGHGVTVITASDHRDAGGGEAAALSNVKVELKYFKCYRESNEVGRDELYWALMAASDTGAKLKSVTREYGGVSSGDVEDFDAGTLLFHNTMQDFLTTHITLWEADHSPGGWYEKLHESIATISDLLFEMADKLAQYGGHFPVPEYHDLIDYMEVAGMIAMAIAGLIKLFTNHDDEVASRTIVMDRAALRAAISDQYPFGWDFNGGGGGHVILVAQPSGIIRSDLRLTSAPYGPDGIVWGKQTKLPDQDVTGTPALAADAYGNPVCVVQGYPDSNHLYWAACQAGTWGAFTRIPGIEDAVSLALTTDFDGRVNLVYGRTDQRLSHWVLDGRTWEHVTTSESRFAYGAPALARHGQDLMCVVRNHDRRLYWTRWNEASPSMHFAGIADSEYRTLNDPVLTTGGASGAYMAVMGDGYLVHWSKFDGFRWAPFTPVPNSKFQGTPALAYGMGQVFFMFRPAGKGEELHWTAFKENSQTWHSLTKHPSASSAYPPALLSARAHSSDPEAPYGRMYCLHLH